MTGQVLILEDCRSTILQNKKQKKVRNGLQPSESGHGQNWSRLRLLRRTYQFSELQWVDLHDSMKASFTKAAKERWKLRTCRRGTRTMDTSTKAPILGSSIILAESRDHYTMETLVEREYHGEAGAYIALSCRRVQSRVFFDGTFLQLSPIGTPTLDKCLMSVKSLSWFTRI